jgi:hypothetical protein
MFLYERPCPTDAPAVKIAVVTPHFRTPADWLRQCLRSVALQTIPCTHFLVCDGDDVPSGLDVGNIQVIRLAKPHADVGNVARTVGSFSAIGQGFEAIAYLDSDNWYEPEHLAILEALHRHTGAAFLSSTRMLFAPDGGRLGICPEVDGRLFVDTNCMFLLRGAFPVISEWCLAPRELAMVADRVVWKRVQELGIACAHHRSPTVNYRTQYLVHFEHFGVTPPPGAKTLLAVSPVDPAS